MKGLATNGYWGGCAPSSIPLVTSPTNLTSSTTVLDGFSFTGTGSRASSLDSTFLEFIWADTTNVPATLLCLFNVGPYEQTMRRRTAVSLSWFQDLILPTYRLASSPSHGPRFSFHYGYKFRLLAMRFEQHSCPLHFAGKGSLSFFLGSLQFTGDNYGQRDRQSA